MFVRNYLTTIAIIFYILNTHATAKDLKLNHVGHDDNINIKMHLQRRDQQQKRGNVDTTKKPNEIPDIELSFEQKLLKAMLTHPTLSKIWQYMVRNNPDLKFLEKLGGLNVPVPPDLPKEGKGSTVASSA